MHKLNDNRIEHCLEEDEIDSYVLQKGFHEEELRISDHIGRRIKNLVKGIQKN